MRSLLSCSGSEHTTTEHTTEKGRNIMVLWAIAATVVILYGIAGYARVQ